MALPNVDQEVVASVVEAEVQERRDAVLSAGANTVVASDAALAAAPATTAVVSPAAVANASDFLASIGITDLHIDFTSFPVITLNDAVFSSPEAEKFGTEFEFRYINKRTSWLFRGDFGRKVDPELVYSDDGLHANNDRRPIAEIIEEWKSKEGYEGFERKEYTLVLGTMVGEPHEGEMVQLQVPQTSRGALDGYLLGLGTQAIDPRQVITKVSVGAERGKGIKTFNPWSFKLVK